MWPHKTMKTGENEWKQPFLRKSVIRPAGSRQDVPVPIVLRGWVRRIRDFFAVLCFTVTLDMTWLQILNETDWN